MVYIMIYLLPPDVFFFGGGGGGGGGGGRFETVLVLGNGKIFRFLGDIFTWKVDKALNFFPLKYIISTLRTLMPIV